MEKLLLTTESNRPLYINTSKLDSIKNELESFCNDTIFSLSHTFPKEILFPYELKNNNAIEGYQQEISSIIKIINNPRLKTNKLDNEYQRIYNMYLGYDFILEKTPITEESLFKLYKILSNKILEKDEMLLPGNKYRHSDVFIHYTSNLSKKPDKGFEHYNIERHMEELFKFINTNNDISEVDLFFKSQIIHFYMVYIHPYFDINGRTARTTSLWFLNNNKSYPYTIFNRAITFNKNNYYKIIRDTKHYKNLTSFVKFVAEGTKLELEKEYIIRSMDENIYKNLTAIDKQVLQYILSNNSTNTLIDIQKIYNRFNPKKNLTYVNDELLFPLFEQEVLLKKRNTSKHIYGDNLNYEFVLNKDKFNFNREKIKRLDIQKFGV